MSSRPLFAVGEDVLLVSKSRPKVNGPAVVLRIFPHAAHCRGNLCSKQFSYSLTIPNIPPVSGWCESALRKRYPPGSSFESIMDSLKEKVPVTS